ncbi:MAG: amino acid racemase [Verrucomicrobiota bacterium]|nr:amino acid racemase [Verrucomicrobiota bacterium]
MKNLGLIGGIGPESTIDYYRTLIEIFRRRQPAAGYPPLFINSVDLQRQIALVEGNNLLGLGAFLSEEIEKLHRAGADFALLASNTPHLVFDDLQRASPIPLLSIVEVTAAEAKQRGLKRVGLFGTGFTMRARFYPEVFSRVGIEVIVPESSEQEFIHDKYMNELINGIFRPETRARLLAIVDRLKAEAQIGAVVLGGTELPLILRDEAHNGIPFLNTTRLHCEAAVDRMLS